MPERLVQLCMFVPLMLIWGLAIGVTVWLVRLVTLSYALSDAFAASVGICIVALPVYWTLVGVLTYTFFGLRRGARSGAQLATAPGYTEGSAGPDGQPTSRAA